MDNTLIETPGSFVVIQHLTTLTQWNLPKRFKSF